jgi:hypothetical protein
MARRGSSTELTVRLEAFERRYGMPTREFVARYEEADEVEGIHPHVAVLWYSGYRILRRLGSSDLERLEALLTP